MQKLVELVRVYRTVQKERIAFDNMIASYGSLELNKDTDVKGYLEAHSSSLKLAEKALAKEMAKEVTNIDVYNVFLKHVKGIGKLLSAQLIAEILDATRFDTIAKLWRYMGLGVVDGKAERRVRGQQAKFNPRRKALMYNIGVSIIRGKGGYSKVYYGAKQYYTANRDWKPIRIHYAAMRKMEKMFLAHLWYVWRYIRGAEIRPPYAIEYLKHTTIYTPIDFVDTITKKLLEISEAMKTQLTSNLS